MTLVESEDLLSITSVGQWGGINLEGFNLLQDTASCVFTKQYARRAPSCYFAVQPLVSQQAVAMKGLQSVQRTPLVHGLAGFNTTATV